jgi:uncharacterized membrane protein YfcA
MSGFSYVVPPSLLLSTSARKWIQVAAHLSEVFIVGIAGLIYWTSDLEEGYVIPHGDVLMTGIMTGAFAVAVLWIAMGALAYFYQVYLPQTKPQETPEQAFTATGN